MRAQQSSGWVRFAALALVAAVLMALSGVVGAEGRADGMCFGMEPTHVGTAGNDTIEGTPDVDVIVGGGGKDVLKGMGGDDRICGEGGNDRLIGGDGADRLNGGAGKDTVKGQGGNDILIGGGADDTLIGGGGGDKLKGKAGDDLLKGGAGKDRLNGGTGMFDTAFGGGGTDTCTYIEDRHSCERPRAANWALRTDGFGPASFGDSEASVRTALNKTFGDPTWEDGPEWRPCYEYTVIWERNDARVSAQFLDSAFVGYSARSEAFGWSTPEGVREGSTGAEVIAAYPDAQLDFYGELGWLYHYDAYEFWMDSSAETDPHAATVRRITVGQYCIPV